MVVHMFDSIKKIMIVKLLQIRGVVVESRSQKKKVLGQFLFSVLRIASRTETHQKHKMSEEERL